VTETTALIVGLRVNSADSPEALDLKQKTPKLVSDDAKHRGMTILEAALSFRSSSSLECPKDG
jgi:hypothetical protein